jgi:hypothetical protein
MIGSFRSLKVDDEEQIPLFLEDPPDVAASSLRLLVPRPFPAKIFPAGPKPKQSSPRTLFFKFSL